MPMLKIFKKNGKQYTEFYTELSVQAAYRILLDVPPTGEQERDRFRQSIIHQYETKGDRMRENRRNWLIFLAQEILDSKNLTTETKVTWTTLPTKPGNNGSHAAATQPLAPAPGPAPLKPIHTLLMNIRPNARYRFPNVYLTTDAGTPILICITGPQSTSHHGSVTVKNSQTGLEYGHINSRGESDIKDPDVLELLTAFAADPATVIMTHGSDADTCAFCNTALPADTEINYCAKCAKHLVTSPPPATTNQPAQPTNMSTNDTPTTLATSTYTPAEPVRESTPNTKPDESTVLAELAKETKKIAALRRQLETAVADNQALQAALATREAEIAELATTGIAQTAEIADLKARLDARPPDTGAAEELKHLQILLSNVYCSSDDDAAELRGYREIVEEISK